MYTFMVLDVSTMYTVMVLHITTVYTFVVLTQSVLKVDVLH